MLLSQTFAVSNFFIIFRLTEIVQAMEGFAPTRFAEKWDNVGVLIEPSTSTDIKKIFLTNDLTEHVMEEALENKANLIISYHPPIFSGLKRLTTASWKERIILQCIENRIALYSPHTSWDAWWDFILSQFLHSYFYFILAHMELTTGSPERSQLLQVKFQCQVQLIRTTELEESVN